MIYLKNNNEEQLVYIPRIEPSGEIHPSGGGEYTAGDYIDISPSNVISVTGITELIDAKQDILIAGTNIKTINHQSLLGEGNIDIQGGGQEIAYDSLKKIRPYLYDISYDYLDYTYASQYFEQGAPVNIGACSAWADVENRVVGRNYDWLYDNEANFVVRTSAAQGRYASVGVASHPSILNENVEARIYTEDYKILPFFLQDGINSEGLFCEINVVPSAGNTQNTPLIETRDRVSAIAIVRYILDNYASVQEALADLPNYVQIYMPESLTSLGYEAHLLIYDGTNCRVLEMVDNELVDVDSEISTNFHLHGVTANTDGSVNTNYTAKAHQFASDNGIEEYGSGLERWNILAAARMSHTADMRETMDAVKFSQAYTVTAVAKCWYSEFVGDDGVKNYTTDTVYSQMNTRVREYRDKWAERDRETAEVWITRHSCVYDIDNLSFSICVEEESDAYNIELNSDYATKAWVEEQGYVTEEALESKQDTLVSGTNIKTINNQSILGEGNIDIQGGGGSAVPTKSSPANTFYYTTYNNEQYDNWSPIYDEDDNELTVLTNNYNKNFGIVVMDGSVKKIGRTVFFNGGYGVENMFPLNSITIPEGVTEIGDWNFSHGGYGELNQLTFIQLPSTLEHLATRCFINYNYCDVQVVCYAVVPPTTDVGGSYFGGGGRFRLYVPADSVNAYKADAQWGKCEVYPIAYATLSDIYGSIGLKQDKLVDSGLRQNIKTINGTSLLGRGDISITSGEKIIKDYSSLTTADCQEIALNPQKYLITVSSKLTSYVGEGSNNSARFGYAPTTHTGKLQYADIRINGSKTLGNIEVVDLTTLQETLVSGENIKSINGMSVLGEGNIALGTGWTGVTGGDSISIDDTGNINLVSTQTGSLLYNLVQYINGIKDDTDVALADATDALGKANTLVTQMSAVRNFLSYINTFMSNHFSDWQNQPLP